MPRQWMIVFAQFAVLNSFLLAYVCAAESKYGTISVVGPAFVNREVTLKATLFYPWGCDVEWKYIKVGETTFKTMTGTNVTRYSEDGSFILKWKASNEYNGSTFHAGCSKNQTIKTSMTSINITGGNTNSVKLHISERPSYPVLGPKFPDFNITECIYVYGGSEVYCRTENGTEPVQVLLLIGQDSIVLSESEGNKGSHRLYNADQQMAGLLRQNVTCRVSYSALEKPYEVRGNLCNVETGSLPFLIVPEFLQSESSLYVCEVRNAIPAPTIEIHVDNVLLGDVQQTDTFNESSHTFTSSAKVTKANKMWNGKEMCCTRKSKYDFGPNNVSVCKTVSMKYPPSDLSMCVNKNKENNKNVSVCFFNMSCETDESKRPCTIEWLSDNDNLINVDRTYSTIGGKSYRLNSYVMYNVTKEMAGGTIRCSTRCNHSRSHSDKDYEVSSQANPPSNLKMIPSVRLPPNTAVVVKCTVNVCNAQGQWTLRWEDGNRTEIKMCNTAEKCLLTLKYTGDREITDICKSQDLLNISLTVTCSKTTDDRLSKENGIQTFPFPVNDVLIGTGVICGLCILFVLGRGVFLKLRKGRAVNIMENVEHHSADTSSDNGVLHIATEGIEYAVVQRQASTQRTGTQQPLDDDGLTYAELDIKFLQEKGISAVTDVRYSP